MKNLTTEQQADLQALIEKLTDSTYQMDNEDHAALVYWSIELKPKRIRRKNEEKVLIGMSEAVQYAIDNGSQS